MVPIVEVFVVEPAGAPLLALALASANLSNLVAVPAVEVMIVSEKIRPARLRV